MSLKKFFFRWKPTYKTYLYYNLYLRHRGFLKKKRYSQWGEDLEIQDFFKDTKVGKFIDVGCFHPFLFNNTFLLYRKGWQGINIDLNQVSIDLFNIARSRDINICSAISEKGKTVKVYYDGEFSSVNTLDIDFYKKSKEVYFKDLKTYEIEARSIQDILKDNPAFSEIDFINIDVEGLDYEVLKQIDLKKFKTKLVAIETHYVDGLEIKEYQKILTHFNNLGFSILKKVGPTTIFKSN